MNFPQFAFNNVRRNARAYVAYLLSSSFMVMIFFTYAVFVYHPKIANSEMGSMTRIGMSIATAIVYVFAFFFVMYSISVFLKSRNREFGILTILGAESRQINLLIFLENILIGAVAILTGIAAGLMLSKVFLLVSTRMIDMDDLPFYWPAKAILLTAGAFILLFLFISMFTLMFIRKRQVLDLLTGSSKPKKEPKANVFTFLLGIALLSTGYWALHGKKLDEIGLMIAAVTGIAGTYFFYSQLSVWVVKKLQRSRSAAWKGTNLLWISEMSYKLKDNARMLFLVTVVVALACMSTGFVLASQQSIRDSYMSNPFNFRYTTYSDGDKTKAGDDLAYIEQSLRTEGMKYRVAKADLISDNSYAAGKEETMLISQSQFNRLASVMNIDPVDQLGETESVMIQSPETERKYPPQGNTLNVRIAESTYPFQFVSRTDRAASLSYRGKLLVVQDEVFERLEQEHQAGGGYVQNNTVFMVPDSGKLPGKEDAETKLGVELTEWSRSGDHGGLLQSRAENYYTFKQTFSLFSFIGVFIALIFSVSSASFLYFKLHTELTADAVMYRSLSKIGLSSREMNVSATIQIAVLFFIPIAVATLQSLVVLGPVMEMMNSMSPVYVPVLTASAAFLAVQAVYFLIVRARYIKAVNKTMV
ncbi:putative ABC transport system permease protein [Fontibacillus phaseoli]|uniref:Putative ABC transport system permease protein n=1 Tax=Fontibacillus phaseoli TaxID=1416533 RepID=A0A369BIS9_9BACL|nr:ABC transporter permease [Fontibacillus phaseoli]RCX21500.1 putative ABC transport system permease protein [Fontibacillus phaseoli]